MYTNIHAPSFIVSFIVKSDRISSKGFIYFKMFGAFISLATSEVYCGRMNFVAQRENSANEIKE